MCIRDSIICEIRDGHSNLQTCLCYHFVSHYAVVLRVYPILTLHTCVSFVRLLSCFVDTPCWIACADFPNVVAQRHILGVCTQGAMTPKFELGRDFCIAPISPTFIILCLLVRKLSCWQTNTQTQTPLKTSNALRYATTLGKDYNNRISNIAVL